MSLIVQDYKHPMFVNKAKLVVDYKRTYVNEEVCFNRLKILRYFKIFLP